VRLSVVIAAWNGKDAVERCLRSLECDTQAADTEVIVVTNFESGTREMVREQFPCVRHVSLPLAATVPQLRSRGIEHSQGEIVALAEDHCTFQAEWCSAVKKAHDLPYGAIGGGVENASGGRALDWAVYFYDYGKFMLPLTAGVAPSLSGNNVSYKRTVLEEVKETFRDGFFEPFTHGEIVRRGHALYLTPAVVVYNRRNHQTREAVAQAYHLARGYAGKRMANAGLVRRAAFVAGSLILPFLLPARIVIRTVRKRRLIGKLVGSLPFLLLLTSSWSFGEFCGYLAGEGHSSEKWN
jgi:glycosyltransferase involved in cell wall biosynthesis